MTFEEHVAHHRRADGGYDLGAAESARAAEIAASPGAVDELARKAAHDERVTFERRAGEHRRKQFTQGFEQLALLDLEVLIPIGDGIVVPLGDMNEERIRIREDLANENFLKHSRAYDAESTFWRQARRLLPPGGSVGDIA